VIRKRVVWGSLAVGCAVALAACGSSHKPSTNAAAGSSSRALAFANCMRSHGVPSFPDPGGGGGGVQLGGTGVNPQSPAFKSARKACGGLLPGGRAGGPPATQNQFLAALKFSQCMRAHGLADFPDPTRLDAPPGPILIIGNGLYFRVGTSFNPEAPAVHPILVACGGG
jgi:hypothetical protein